LTIFPDDQTQPVVSTLNSYDGRTKATAAIVGAGAVDAGVSIYVPDATDVVLDVAGYWVGPSNPATGKLQYFNIPGFNVCRLVNTSNATGPLGGPPLSGGTARDFPVQSGFCAIPSTAVAYSLNVTAVPINGAPVSYVTVWPSTQAQPGTSTLNAPTGTTVENAAVIPTGGGAGDISVFSPDDTNILIDINGYFAPPVSGASLALYTTTPCRVLDTRSTSGLFNGQIDVQVQPLSGGGPCNLPPFTITAPFIEGYVLNATALPGNGAGLGYLSVWPTGLPQPLPATLVALDGSITSNLAITLSDGGYASALASSPTNLLLDISGYFSSDTLVITTTSLPAGTQFTPYTTTVVAQGGVPPYTWSDLGTLPPSLTIGSASGIISGCPDVNGAIPVTIQVTDTVPTVVTAAFTLTLAPYVPVLFVNTDPLPGGLLNQPYMDVITAMNGLGPYKFTLTGGALPTGLSLTAAGVISGTPVATGTFTFQLTATDSSCDNPSPGNQAIMTYHITIT